MTNFEDTIAAISTAPGAAALSVLRLSGSKSFEIALSIFKIGAKKSSLPEIKSNFARHGFLVDPISGDIVDEVVLTPFAAPHTYTGEDLVEISCHGSPVVAKTVLELLLRSGARLARPGEFTQRAFLSGRIDLTQAEAVLDLIQAKTSVQGKAAVSALTGRIGDQIREVRSELVVLLTRIVAGLDFPEEIGDAPEPEIETVTTRCKEKLDQLCATARSGHFLRDGLRLTICGRPNAGKSSLLNRLLQFERAIVTDIPGTTRDSLEETLDLNGIPVVLVDTAGVRHTEDHVEKIGIERTHQSIDRSDLTVVVIDLKAGWGEPEDALCAYIGNRPLLIAGNKIDLVDSSQRDLIDRELPKPDSAIDRIYISATTGSGIDELTGAIERFVYQDTTSREGPTLNARQSQLCVKAQEALALVLDTLSGGYPQDCLATDLKTAVDALSEIEGGAVSEEIITQVFATFCIGK